MHARTIDGVTHTFGNESTLYLSAMTWFDHETESTWSQPTGRAINGPHLSTELYLLPVHLTTWENWVADHPHTLVLTDDIKLMPNLRQQFRPDFVIGVVWDGQAKAYRYEDVIQTTVINDTLGDVPVLIWAQDGKFHTYIRRVEDQVLTFALDDEGKLVDVETGSEWDVVRGFAPAGQLRHQALQPLPNLTAFEDHWWDFYPESTLYEP